MKWTVGPSAEYKTVTFAGIGGVSPFPGFTGQAGSSCSKPARRPTFVKAGRLCRSRVWGGPFVARCDSRFAVFREEIVERFGEQVL